MNKKEYMSPDFKIVVLRAKHSLLQESFTKGNTKKEDIEKIDGDYFD